MKNQNVDKKIALFIRQSLNISRPQLKFINSMIITQLNNYYDEMVTLTFGINTLVSTGEISSQMMGQFPSIERDIPRFNDPAWEFEKSRRIVGQLTNEANN